MLGESGFPVGLATMERTILIAKSFVTSGAKVTVICRKGVQPRNAGIEFPAKGVFENIDYIYTVDSIYKPKGFANRNFQKLKGIYGEFKQLRRLKKHQGIDLAIVSELKVVHIFRFLLYASLFDFKIALNFMEMTSSMQHRKKILKKINDYILDNWAIRLFDAALPISDQLMAYYRKVMPSKPCMKLPIICDFDKFDIPKAGEEPYFLYCGSFRYKEVRDFIVEAYRSTMADEHTKLYMIVSGGGKDETLALQEELNSKFDTEPIKLFSNIPYEQLIYLYRNAIAMLIPLRDTVQDAARFPHKIGEYLASGNPVITTAVGEIKLYFRDGKTALVADTYSKRTFAEKMQYVLDNPKKAIEIGHRGKEMGLREFHYKTHGPRLMDFMERLSNNKEDKKKSN